MKQYKFKDTNNKGFFEGEDYIFNSVQEVISFLIDDFINFRITGNNFSVEELSLKFMLDYLKLELVEFDNLKKDVEDKFLKKYIKAITDTEDEEGLKIVINRIYENGFEDGTNDDKRADFGDKYLSTNLSSDENFVIETSYRLEINEKRNGNLDLVNEKTGNVACEFQNNEVEK